MLTQPD